MSMSIEELLFDIAMSDGSPEAYQIIKTVPKEHWNEVVKLWEDGIGNDLTNADSNTRLRYIADSILNDIEANTNDATVIADNDDRPLWVGGDGEVHIGEPGEEYTKQYGAVSNNIRRALDEHKEKSKPYKSEKKHFGEEQMADLKNLLGGMKEGPDNRF